jgi:hypothetical protein
MTSQSLKGKKKNVILISVGLKENLTKKIKEKQIESANELKASKPYKVAEILLDEHISKLVADFQLDDAPKKEDQKIKVVKVIGKSQSHNINKSHAIVYECYNRHGEPLYEIHNHTDCYNAAGKILPYGQHNRAPGPAVPVNPTNKEESTMEQYLFSGKVAMHDDVNFSNSSDQLRVAEYAKKILSGGSSGFELQSLTWTKDFWLWEIVVSVPELVSEDEDKVLV